MCRRAASSSVLIPPWSRAAVASSRASAAAWSWCTPSVQLAVSGLPTTRKSVPHAEQNAVAYSSKLVAPTGLGLGSEAPQATADAAIMMASMIPRGRLRISCLQPFRFPVSDRRRARLAAVAPSGEHEAASARAGRVGAGEPYWV